MQIQYISLSYFFSVVCGVLIFLLGVATLFDVLYKSYQVKANEQEPHGQDTNPEAKYRVNGDRHKPTKARKPGKHQTRGKRHNHRKVKFYPRYDIVPGKHIEQGMSTGVITLSNDRVGQRVGQDSRVRS